MIGTIASKIKDKGYGFINSNGKDYFFHISQCITPFDELEKGDEVDFETESSNKGLRAVGVEKI